jgi:hypothetical protein
VVCGQPVVAVAFGRILAIIYDAILLRVNLRTTDFLGPKVKLRVDLRGRVLYSTLCDKVQPKTKTSLRIEKKKKELCDCGTSILQYVEVS